MTKWQFLLIFLKRVEKDPFLSLQMRAKKDLKMVLFYSFVLHCADLMFDMTIMKPEIKSIISGAKLFWE